MAESWRIWIPVPSSLRDALIGPSPASMNKIPEGVRTIVQLPPEPLARIQISMDIRVILSVDASLSRDVCFYFHLNPSFHSVLGLPYKVRGRLTADVLLAAILTYLGRN